MFKRLTFHEVVIKRIFHNFIFTKLPRLLPEFSDNIGYTDAKFVTIFLQSPKFMKTLSHEQKSIYGIIYTKGMFNIAILGRPFGFLFQI